ncbi:MAG: helix-turn-helix domain-containing protein [Nanoarchaeota archaeon]
MEIEKALETLNLSKTEAKVYLALLQIGETPVGQLAKKLQSHRTNVYDSLNNLHEKGMVSFTIKNGTKNFKASNPDTILSIFKTKEAEIAEAISEIKSISRNVEESEAYFSQGINSAKQAMLDTLNSGEVLIFTIPKKAAENLEAFFSEYHKQRIKKKILLRQICNQEITEHLAKLKKLPLTKARFLSAKYDSPVSTIISGNKTTLIIWTNPVSVITINNPEVSAAYRNYFDILWESAS